MATQSASNDYPRTESSRALVDVPWGLVKAASQLPVDAQVAFDLFPGDVMRSHHRHPLQIRLFVRHLKLVSWSAPARRGGPLRQREGTRG
jgi:hypothetical protein